MKPMTRWLAVVGLVVCLSAMAVPSTHGYLWTGNSYYSVSYTDSSYSSYISKFSYYLNESFRSAFRVLGNRGNLGKITIYFYYKAPASNGTYEVANAPVGGQTINLNTYAIQNMAGNEIGATIAHETSHILFCNYVNGKYWYNTSTQMWYYYYMLTESLARFTGDQSYLYGAKSGGKWVQKYSASYIRLQLLNFSYLSSEKILSWYGAGYYYNNLSTVTDTYLVQQVLWQFQAMGHYFTNGNWNMGYKPLMYTLYYMRAYASKDGVYLRSSNYSTCRCYFEYAFYKGYGYYANAGWIYGAYYNTNYLYGKWWYQWYVA